MAKDPFSEEAERGPEYLSTLERGLAVLNVFYGSKPQLTLSEIAAKLDLNPAVARRCLNTLIHLGYVGKRGRSYLLRPKVLEFGDAFLSSANIEQAIMPYLKRLRDETGDSTSMAVRSGDDAMFLAHVSPIGLPNLDVHVGTRLPLHATSFGKAILAFLPHRELDDYLANSHRQQYTTNTFVELSSLKDEIDKVRRSGFASARDEYDYGVSTLAMPILSEDKRVIAAISCLTNTSRSHQPDYESSRLPFLREAASQIERTLLRFPSLDLALKV